MKRRGEERHLEEYERKRDFSRTPEPRAVERPADAGPGSFVVQKHQARRLHYDFRLELDGTLKSWAVPKGPSLDPSVRSLAVHVEDHPLDYASFEGVIPRGEYGGGTVMVWDRGRWLPEGDPGRDYEKGHLRFRLQGEKLRGRWMLIRMSGEAGEEGKNWLLRKVDDAHARSEDEFRVVEALPLSVATGRTLEEIARDRDRVWSSEGEPLPAAPEAAPPGETPEQLRPQLPTLVGQAPEGDEWLHELKLDGYRILARMESGDVRLLSRRGHDWTDRFPGVAEALRTLGTDSTVVDGEVVVLARDGTTDFQALQNVLERGGRSRIAYFAFDLPHYRGRDLTGLPLTDRKELLGRVLATRGASGVLRFSDHIVGRGPSVLAQACRRSLEGIVSKRADSVYRPGRQRSWVKVKCRNRQEFVVGGWTDPKRSRAGFGALLLGWFDEQGRLVYAGRVGTGFTGDDLERVRARLDRVAAGASPFQAGAPVPKGRDVHWVRPELVVEVRFGGWTEEGILRHASFQGVREDKPGREVTLETPTGGSRRDSEGARGPRSPRPRGGGARVSGVRVGGVRLSNPDRLLYPEEGLTKRDVARYYEEVADRVLPHLVDRPLTMVRCPKGREGTCFYQKHLTEGIPEPVRGVEVKEEEGSGLYVVIDDLAGLITLVQFGVLEFHPWGSRADRLERPDRLIFDLDPGEGVDWGDVVRAAQRLGKRLEALDLTSFVRTTGGKGLHVVVPLVRRSSWEEVKAFARDVAEGLVREDRRRFIATASKAERKGKIFVDYLRNSRGATAIASYSTRARPGAPVATPVRWDELPRLERPDAYRATNVPARLRALAADPWEGFFEVQQSITNRMKAAVAGGR